MRSNIEVKPKHRQESSRLSWKTTRYTRKYVAFNTIRERFLKTKSFKDRVQDLHFQRKQTNFAFTAQFRSRCDQTSRSNRNIGKNPQRLSWKTTRYTRKYVAFNSFRERFSKIQSLQDRVQDLHFQRKQTKFRLHCTISI